MRRLAFLSLVVAAAAAPAALACGEPPEIVTPSVKASQEARQVAQSFLQSVAAKDSAAFCGLLSRHGLTHTKAASVTACAASGKSITAFARSAETAADTRLQDRLRSVWQAAAILRASAGVPESPAATAKAIARWQQGLELRVVGSQDEFLALGAKERVVALDAARTVGDALVLYGRSQSGIVYRLTASGDRSPALQRIGPAPGSGAGAYGIRSVQAESGAAVVRAVVSGLPRTIILSREDGSFRVDSFAL